MTLFPARRLAPAAAAALLIAAAPAAMADPTVTSTPKLYAVSGAHQGRPVAYVVFRTASRVHRTDAVRVTVAGRTGRTYSVGSGTCLRAAFVRETAAGKPLPFLKAGRSYKVRIRYDGRTIRTVTLKARRASSAFSKIPRC